MNNVKNLLISLLVTSLVFLTARYVAIHTDVPVRLIGAFFQFGSALYFFALLYYLVVSFFQRKKQSPDNVTVVKKGDVVISDHPIENTLTNLVNVFFGITLVFIVIVVLLFVIMGTGRP